MRPFTTALLAGIVGVMLCAVPARAQQQTPSLPDIAPREVEIRGELGISLPALQRPALTGLRPPLPEAPLPPLPAPSLEAAEPPSAAPPALREATDAPAGFATLPPPRAGLVEVGGGRYLSRFARARAGVPLAPRWSLRARLDYEGTDGFEPFGEDNLTAATPADDLRGAATVRTERASFTAALTADGFFEQDRLYGTAGASDGLVARPNRDRYGGGAALRVQAGSAAGRSLEAHARYDAAHVATDALVDEETASVPASFERTEQRARGSLEAGLPLGDLRAEADVHGSLAQLGSAAPSGAEEDAPSTAFLDAGAGLWLLRSGPFRAFVGARLLTFSAQADAGGPYVAPDVRLSWQPDPRLSLYARTDPHVEANLLAARYRENPSLLTGDAPQPNVSTLDAEGGLRFFPTPAVELRVFGGYRQAPSFLFYEADRSFYERGATAARYGDARILRAGGSLSLRHGSALHASLSATYRSGRLDDGTADDLAEIPYFSPAIAQALLGYDFLDGAAHIEVAGSFESARPRTRAEDAGEVGAFVNLGVEGRYALTPALEAMVRLQNIPDGALERYDRYPRAPLVLQSGLRLNL